MSKERLKEILHKEEYLEGTNDLKVLIDVDNYKWLIKQAKLVHGEVHLNGLKEMYADCNKTVAALNAENKRYQEAVNRVSKVLSKTYGDMLEMNTALNEIEGILEELEKSVNKN